MRLRKWALFRPTVRRIISNALITTNNSYSIQLIKTFRVSRQTVAICNFRMSILKRKIRISNNRDVIFQKRVQCKGNRWRYSVSDWLVRSTLATTFSLGFSSAVVWQAENLENQTAAEDMKSLKAVAVNASFNFHDC